LKEECPPQIDEMMRGLDPPASIAAATHAAPQRVGWFAAFVGKIGAWVIYQLI